MTTYHATVRKALLSQKTLINNGEHFTGDPERLATIGLAVGQQIRVRRASDAVAL